MSSQSSGKLSLGHIFFYAGAMSLSLRWLAVGAALGPVSLMIWVLAALIFLMPLSAACMDLSSRLAEDGAVYAWTRHVFGDGFGFMCGWLYYGSTLPYFAAMSQLVLNFTARAMGGPVGDILSQPVFAFFGCALVILLIGIQHMRGLGIGKWLPIIGSVLTFGLLALISIAGLYVAQTRGPATDFSPEAFVPHADADFAITLGAIIFAYGGAEGVALMRNSAKDGAKTLRRALFLVGLFSVFAYGLGTFGLMSLLSPDQATRLQGLPDALLAASEALSLEALEPLFAFSLIVATLGALSAWFGASAHMLKAGGMSHILPEALRRVDSKTGAPVAALWFQVLLVTGLLALSYAGDSLAGAYDFINAMSFLTYFLPFLGLFAAYYLVQKGDRSPKALRARFIACLGFLTVLSVTVMSLIPSPDSQDPLASFLKLLMATGVMIGLGLIIYHQGIKQQKKQKSS